MDTKRNYKCATATPNWKFHELYAALNHTGLQKQKQEYEKRRDQNKNTLDPKIPWVFWEIKSAYIILKNCGSMSSNLRRYINNIYKDSNNTHHRKGHNHYQHLYHRHIRRHEKDNIPQCYECARFSLCYHIFQEKKCSSTERVADAEKLSS